MHNRDDEKKGFETKKTGGQKYRDKKALGMHVLGLVNSTILLERDVNSRLCSIENVKPVKGFEKKKSLVFSIDRFNRSEEICLNKHSETC